MKFDGSELLFFDDIDKLARTNLLLGNGFSIGVYPRFFYTSLSEVAVEENYLTLEDKKLLDKFNTTDFEALMRRFKEAAELLKLLEIEHEPLVTRYNKIRSGLIKTVKHVHPKTNDIDDDWLEAVAAELAAYRGVYTTNYDLLLYWSIASRKFEGFTDFFWVKKTAKQQEIEFDPSDTVSRDRKTGIHYLHGALFLIAEPTRTFKRRASRQNLMMELGSFLVFGARLPLFVSEGSSQDKLYSIRTNRYLSFAFDSFQNIEKGLVIFGHSLTEQSDGHILQAINDNKDLKVIAISIYSSNKEKGDSIAKKVADYKRKLQPFLRRGGKLQFFRFDSSPFFYGDKPVSWFDKE
jgi:hypothetical protein